MANAPGAQRVGVVRLSRRAHNPEIGGSNPPPVTNSKSKLKVKKRVTAYKFDKIITFKIQMHPIVCSYTSVYRMGSYKVRKWTRRQQVRNSMRRKW